MLKLAEFDGAECASVAEHAKYRSWNSVLRQPSIHPLSGGLDSVVARTGWATTDEAAGARFLRDKLNAENQNSLDCDDIGRYTRRRVIIAARLLANECENAGTTALGPAMAAGVDRWRWPIDRRNVAPPAACLHNNSPRSRLSAVWGWLPPICRAHSPNRGITPQRRRVQTSAGRVPAFVSLAGAETRTRWDA